MAEDPLQSGVLHTQATVIAVGAFSIQQWHGAAWNSPMWPLLPLLLNRVVELGALWLGNIFTSLTVRIIFSGPAVAVTAAPV